MKIARMNISHFRFILFNLKIFGEIVTSIKISENEWRHWNLCLFNRARSVRQVTSKKKALHSSDQFSRSDPRFSFSPNFLVHLQKKRSTKNSLGRWKNSLGHQNGPKFTRSSENSLGVAPLVDKDSQTLTVFICRRLNWNDQRSRRVFLCFYSAIFQLTSAKFQTFAYNSRTVKSSYMKFWQQFEINELYVCTTFRGNRSSDFGFRTRKPPRKFGVKSGLRQKRLKYGKKCFIG